MDGSAQDSGALQLVIAGLAWAGVAVHAVIVFRRWLRELRPFSPTGRGTVIQPTIDDAIGKDLEELLRDLAELWDDFPHEDFQQMLTLLKAFRVDLADELEELFSLWKRLRGHASTH